MSDVFICSTCGYGDCACMCVQPELTNPAPLPDTVTFYISVVRYGIAGWGAGPCGTDYSQVTSALRVYKSIDACRIYPVQLPMPTVPTL